MIVCCECFNLYKLPVDYIHQFFSSYEEVTFTFRGWCKRGCSSLVVIRLEFTYDSLL